MPDTSKCVILARGLGTRMRKQADGVAIDPTQAAAADTGVKAMIPIGRPFLDYLISALADAGIRDVCLVIGPEHDLVRRYYTSEVCPSRVRIEFAIQEQPLGTADAVRTAEAFAGGSEFLLLNSDNYYPQDALARLRGLGRPGVAGFDREAMIRDGNIDADRIAKYALVSADADGFLDRIIEKPDEETLRQMGDHALVSMNCYRLGPAIFEAARRIPRSVRGEFELTDAISYAMAHLGERFRVVPVASAVLDLSMRADIPTVARHLQGVDVRL